FINLPPSLLAHTATPHPRFVNLPTPIFILLTPGLKDKDEVHRTESGTDPRRCVSFSMSCRTKPPQWATMLCSDRSNVLDERLGSSDEGCNRYGVLGRACCRYGCF
ncbi:hypothetical protein DVH24_041500, partial [Malus domestica]